MGFFPVDGFAPDADPTKPGIVLDCDALIPTLNGLQTLPSDVDAGLSAAPSAVASIQVIRLLNGNTRLIAGTAGSASAATSQLLELSQTNWTVQNGAAGPYTATSDARWVFTQYQNTVLAAQPGCQIQASASDTFTAVSGAPKALIVETVLDFVFAFNIDDTDFENTYGNDPDRWICCAAGNPTGEGAWVTSLTTQATTGLLTDTPGGITAAKRIGSRICAFKQTSMYVGDYVGVPNVWEWTNVPGDGLGSWSQYNVVDVEGLGLMFIGYDNIYVFDGTRAQTIGTNRVAEWLFANLDINKAHRIVGFHHRQAWRVYWFFPKTDTGVLDRFICYNYRADEGRGRWGYGEKTVDFAFEYLEPGLTYDDLGTYYATYDDLPNSPYDSTFLSEGTFKPAIINTDRKVCKLEGAGGTSSLLTGFYGIDDLYTAAKRVRPRFAKVPTSATQKHLYAEDPEDSAATFSRVATLSRGNFDTVLSARWHQFSQEFTGDMELLGWHITMIPDSEE